MPVSSGPEEVAALKAIPPTLADRVTVYLVDREEELLDVPEQDSVGIVSLSLYVCNSLFFHSRRRLPPRPTRRKSFSSTGRS